MKLLKIVKLFVYLVLFQEVFVTVRVEESGYFRREGVHVHTEADISLSQAILGGVIRIQVDLINNPLIINNLN